MFIKYNGILRGMGDVLDAVHRGDVGWVLDRDLEAMERLALNCFLKNRSHIAELKTLQEQKGAAGDAEKGGEKEVSVSWRALYDEACEEFRRQFGDRSDPNNPWVRISSSINATNAHSPDLALEFASISPRSRLDLASISP